MSEHGAEGGRKHARAGLLKAPIRVLVVDDSAVVRGLITKLLSADPEIEVSGTAANGELALLELSRRGADVVVLDIEMPVMDGLETLRRIVRDHPGAKTIMVSTLTRRNAGVSLKALELGAADYVPKPEAGMASATDFQRELLGKIKALSPRPPAVPPATAARPHLRVAPLAAQPEVLAIGASTGGPTALLELFTALRGAVRQPILLTQHMPATFTGLFAEQLSRAGDRGCAEARDGEKITPGRCYVAPGGWHMTVARETGGPVIRLSQAPPEHFCRPAVDPMLRTAAEVYGPGVLAAILTGMGADGALGCRAVAEARGRFVVQDEASSVVWGMPGAAAATGLAEQILPLNQLGPWLRRAAGGAAHVE